ncbi:alpha/beta fold hydrolase [Sinimarinibacterium sp. CAU 1509]|uniref:alpha/beta fold hydrolase n=1 Tax=Sinimarinibacterium sp. CAU 1509 TaxID=2562283 RepID=UPI0010AD6C6D|nr:alpha/beta fold hydrolase [Sinimarinibacterium sp. CAU 1509]TJY60898.1 alpha/beta fold hydrolase [Sinimarinibacterium sp. CAU 1509]
MTANARPEKLVCFAHGKESGPWGHKITRLAEIARDRGFQVISPDYSHTHDPATRVQYLLRLNPTARQLVLVGSSMGGYVSAMACAELRPQALFLMAPALYFPGWDDEPQGIPALSSVIHGWRDDIVPVERGLRFAQLHRSELHLLDAGHTLVECLPTVAMLFDHLLQRLSEQP